ncbi:MAG: hypothetical protein R3321_03085 [Nitrososphaeraceae archaeon]|nr:hypothetical protein [Nitrososphaeraceae archaeon]
MKKKINHFLFLITVWLSTGFSVSMGITYFIHDTFAFFHTNDNKQHKKKR